MQRDLNIDVNTGYLVRKEALRAIGGTVNYEKMLSVCCQEVSKSAKVTKFFKGGKTESSEEASG